MPAGRPTTYKKEYIDQCVAMISVMGCTDQQLADIIGIAPATFYDWKLKYPDFAEAIQRSKDEFDCDRVEKSLLHRATGYSHADTHISNHQGLITVTPITKHYPPDVGAGTWWLKNRRGKRWRDKQEIEHTGNITITKDEEEL